VEEGYGIITTYTGADGEMGKNLTIPCCYIGVRDIEARGGEAKRTLWMDGSEVSNLR